MQGVLRVVLVSSYRCGSLSECKLDRELGMQGARPAEPPLSSPAQPSQGDQLGRQGVKRAAEAELQEPTAR